ncbi:YcdB/YcdC domain-containing protein [Qingrenia yutianensis]|uniref:S-layer homology domain-containing protein n=1 Tax=Qingrenia yutianensis TaxID=2763676 RepID=A0A926FB11_9FIRM|nr:YcdB/YcdC domain-containing protein [Qingrenia yutianensis]MBC8595387.1 S-layer homology domain-containing protein [Qingrenia yutianensis]
MKKMICVSLSIAMLITSLFVPSAFAADKGVEQAILTAKNLLDISDDRYVIDEFSQNGEDYNLSWKNRSENVLDGISATVSGGEITSYYKNYERDYDRMKFPTVTKEDAQAKGESFIAKVCPTVFENMKIERSNFERYAGGTYTFTYTRYYDSVPVRDQETYVEVAADSGEVVGFNTNYDRNLTFEDKNGAVGFEKAKDGYIKNFGYELKYVLKYDDKEKTNNAFLAYVPNDVKYYTYLDAMTGELVDVKDLMFESRGGMGDKQSAAMGMLPDDTNNAKSENGAVLSKEEQALNEEIAMLPKQDEIVNKIKAVEEFKIDGGYTVERYKIFKNYDGEYFASVELSNEGAKRGEDYTTKYIKYNLTANRLENYSSYGTDIRTENDKKADFSDMEEKSQKFIDEYYAEFANEFKYTKDVNSDYVYKFNRIYGGIKVNSNFISFAYDEYTGELTNVNFNRDEAKFASKENVKNIDELYSKILTSDTLKLNYIVYRKYGADNKLMRAAKLVYSLDDNYTLYDANTLDEVDYSGEHPVERTYNYDDIENHYVKPYAEKLAQLDIGFDGTSLRPDESVTKRDYLALIALADNRYYFDYASDQLAKIMIRNGIIEKDDKNLDEPVSRIDAVRFMINKLGYKEVASKTSIFNCPFADIPENMIGYATLGAAFGIVSDKSDVLDAQTNLTRADALIIIYNYLTRE